jgi:hypothetical protein
MVTPILSRALQIASLIVTAADRVHTLHDPGDHPRNAVVGDTSEPDPRGASMDPWRVGLRGTQAGAVSYAGCGA